MVRWWVEDELDIHNMQVTMCPCPICHGCQMSHVHWLTVSICLVWDIHLQRRGKWMKMATFALLLFLWCTQFHRWCPWECLNLSASVFKGIHFIKFIEEVPSSIGYRIQPDVNTGIISQNYTTPTHYNMGSQKEWLVPHPWPHHLLPVAKLEGIPRHLQRALPQTASATDWHACRGGGWFFLGGNF